MSGRTATPGASNGAHGLCTVPAPASAAPAVNVNAGLGLIVAPGATLPDLLQGGYAMVSSALGVLRALELDDDALFAVLHLLRQAEAVIGMANDLAEKMDDAGQIGGAA